jgi:hypothetical protein
MSRSHESNFDCRCCFVALVLAARFIRTISLQPYHEHSAGAGLNAIRAVIFSPFTFACHTTSSALRQMSTQLRALVGRLLLAMAKWEANIRLRIIVIQHALANEQEKT